MKIKIIMLLVNFKTFDKFKIEIYSIKVFLISMDIDTFLHWFLSCLPEKKALFYVTLHTIVKFMLNSQRTGLIVYA